MSLNSKVLLKHFRSAVVAVAVSAKCGTFGKRLVSCPSLANDRRKSFPLKEQEKILHVDSCTLDLNMKFCTAYQ